MSSEKELEQAGHEDAERFEKILSHFNLACAIADQMLTYQEAGQFLEQSLAHLAFGLAFFDDCGDLIWANTEMQRLASGGNMGSSIASMDLAPQNGGESCFPIPRSSKLNEN